MCVGEEMNFDDDEIKKIIGNNIKMYRKFHLEMSREKFIDGITDKFGSIENIEMGKSYPDVDFLVKTSNKYHVPIKSFIDTGYRDKKSFDAGDMFPECSEYEIYEILKQLSVEKYRVLRQIKVMDNVKGRNDMSWSLYMESVGRYLYNERIKKSITHENLSELSGVAVKTIMNIESCNNKGISVKTLYRLCCALKIPIDYVLCERLVDKTEATGYLFTDIFGDVDERERIFLKKYIKLVTEYRKLY